MPSSHPRQPPRSRLRAHALASLLVAALLAAGLLAGCGSSSPGGTNADPASAVPASAMVYAGATVRPSGLLAKNALAVGRALTHQTDPYLKLLALLQTPGSATLNYQRDVAPWLGEHAGVFFTSLRSSSALGSLLQQGLLGSGTSGAFPFSSGGVEGAIVLDTSNIAKARSFLDAQAARAGAHPSSYRGVSYQATSSGVAFGMVKRFAVIGSESGLRDVIDTVSGDSPLAQASGYAKLLAGAPANTLAHLYASAASSTRVAGQEELSSVLQVLTGGHEANISLVPSATSLTIDTDTLSSAAGAQSGLLSPNPEGAQALSELPGESWLAIGLGHVGATLSEDTQDIQELISLGSSLGSSGPIAPISSGVSVSSLLAALTTPLRILGASTPEAKREFASWMGSAGIYASGASLLELHAAVSISSKNPALSREAVSELADQLQKTAKAVITPVSIPGAQAAVGVRLSGLPLVLVIADARAANGQTKFVLGLAEASVQSALNPVSTLASAPSRVAAVGALDEGIQPNLMVSFPTFVSLFEGVGLLEQPPLSQLAPYLRTLTTLAGGGRQLSGEVQRYRLTLGVQ